MIHCPENTGYAIKSLESVFLASAKQAGFNEENIFWSFKTIESHNNPQIIACDYFDKKSHAEVKKFIIDNNIQIVLAFDLGFPCPIIPTLKQAGVKQLISYWGASMSSINSGFRLKLKQLECLLTKSKPDVFIFESEAMRKTATHGRGIKESITDIIYLGVDTQKFFPDYGHDTYIYDALKIPKNRRIVFYSGHMEERKGVRVLTNAAIYLVDDLRFEDIHFVICGNKNNEADAYETLLKGTKARNHVTFAGYRSDIPNLLRGSYIGVIASTGWDSFTMSSIEMMASGLPLIVSDLQGLSETIEHEKNGYLIAPGDHQTLANYIKRLVEKPWLAEELSAASRQRAESLFSADVQINAFSDLIKKSCDA
jgi:glycosyltransferase involved in cell wall biosynthesis